MLESEHLELERTIKLQIRERLYSLNASKESIKTAGDRLKSAEKSFEIVKKKYANGMSSQIEFLDARNSFTNRLHQRNINTL